jgi:hypothetical protein
MTSTTAPGLTAGLAERAMHAAHAHRAADPDAFHHRHDDPSQWNRWTRRARVARTIAATLQVGVVNVLVTDDPHRQYHTRTGPVPDDLIIIDDPATGHTWRFIPDVTTPGDGWLLLDRCPDCDAEIPVTRAATLGDLGEYLDPDGHSPLASEARDESIHQRGCAFVLPRGARLVFVSKNKKGKGELSAMSTKTDFYLGRGHHAEWLGSLQWECEPENLLRLRPGRLALTATDEPTYRAAMADLFITWETEHIGRAYPRRRGWPWPWQTSHKSSWIIAFDPADNNVFVTIGGGTGWKQIDPHNPNEPRTGDIEPPDIDAWLRTPAAAPSVPLPVMRTPGTVSPTAASPRPTNPDNSQGDVDDDQPTL